MRNRYKPVALVAGLLVLMSLVVQIINRTAYHKNDNDQENVTLVLLFVTALVMVIASYWWSVRFPLGQVVPELLLILAIGCVAIVVIDPLVTAISPFASGAGDFFEKIWIYLGFTIGGSVLGWLIALALGRDYRGKALARYAKTVTSKPHRVVRR
jgi:membrane-associated HD superfamily phosphohydrolase